MKKNIIDINNNKLITYTIAGLSLTLILFQISNPNLNLENNTDLDLIKIEKQISLNEEFLQNNILDTKYFENKTFSFKENNIQFLNEGKFLFSNKEGLTLNGKYDLKFDSLFLNIGKKFNTFDFSINNLKLNENGINGKLNNKEEILLGLI